MAEAVPAPMMTLPAATEVLTTAMKMKMKKYRLVPGSALLQIQPVLLYAADSAKTYALTFNGHNVRFSVADGKLRIEAVE